MAETELDPIRLACRKAFAFGLYPAVDDTDRALKDELRRCAFAFQRAAAGHTVKDLETVKSTVLQLASNEMAPAMLAYTDAQSGFFALIGAVNRMA